MDGDLKHAKLGNTERIALLLAQRFWVPIGRLHHKLNDIESQASSTFYGENCTLNGPLFVAKTGYVTAF